MVPAIQLIYQNVLEIRLEVDNFYIGTLYSTIASFKKFLLISTLDLELILSRKKPTSRPAEFRLHGKVSVKKGQGSGH